MLSRACLAVLLVIGTIPALSGSAAFGSISGTVTDDSFDPVGGIDVIACAVDLTCEVASTDSSGSYTIDGLAAGTYVVRFATSSDTYAPQYYDSVEDRESAAPVVVVAGSVTSGIDGALVVGGSVSGTVTDESANPLVDMFVVACSPGLAVCKSTFSKASGSYAIGGLPTGVYTVKFEDPWYAIYLSEYYDDASSEESATLVSVVAGSNTPGIDAALSVPGAISGTVTDESAKPLPSIGVYVCTRGDVEVCESSSTDDNGSFTVRGLRTDMYSVRFLDPGDRYVEEFYDDAPDLESATPVSVVAGSVSSDIDAVLALGGFVSGTVTNESGRALADISVEVCSEDWAVCHTGWTSETGSYSVGGMQTGRYSVFFSDPSDVYFSEFYDDQIQQQLATWVSVVVGLETPEIDAMLVEVVDGAFVDTGGSIFAADIEWLFDRGITKGCGKPAARTFCPGRPVTRGEMAAFLVRALDLTDAGDGNVFEDDDDSIFEADIDRLATAGITRGCDPPERTRFCPDVPVSRGEFAAFMVRAMGYTSDGGGDAFEDDDDSIFEADIDRLAAAGVTRGCNPPDNTEFCPSSPVTRGQVAAFLHRALVAP